VRNHGNPKILKIPVQTIRHNFFNKPKESEERIMKKAIIIAMCVACSVLSAGAVSAGDWVPSGANMYYTGGNIGIGTTTPSFLLHVATPNNPNMFTIDGGNNWVRLNQTQDKIGFLFETSSKTVAGDVKIVSNNESGQVLRVEGNALTTGSTAFIRNYSFASTGKAVYAQNNGRGNALYVEQGNSGNAAEIRQWINTTYGTAGDTTGLYVNVNNTMGKGTGLYIDAYGTAGKSYAAIFNTGNVGIGIADPKYALSVLEKAYISGNNPELILYDISSPTMEWRVRNQNSYFTLYPTYPQADGTVTYGNKVFMISENGNVSIGAEYNVPNFLQSKLAVNGTITAKEVVVTLTGWADHVFNDDYKLMSLNELEKSIKTDKHLPGIPSADEVKKNGVSIGDMQAKLLQKVEELTLHVIEQNKKLENLKTENETLKKQMTGLQENVKR